MSLAKIGEVVSSVITGGKRFVKVRLLGNNDIQEVVQVSPHGIDSAPPTGTKSKALHVETLNRGSSVIVAYVNDNQQAKDGELRLSSTDAQGVEQTFIYLHDDGTIDIGGDSDNMVRYAPLNSGLQSFKGNVDTNFAQIAAVLNSIVPGSYTPTPTSIDITGSKITEIKTS